MRKGAWLILLGLISLILIAVLFFPKRMQRPPEAPSTQSLIEPTLPRFLLHPGFELQALTSAPPIQNPSFAAWDFQGRLWVAEKSTNLVRLAPNQNGNFDRQLELADIGAPITGLLPTPGGILVSAKPRLWLINPSGTNGGPANKRDLSELVPAANRENAVGLNILAALDNWIYTAGGTYRFKMRRNQWLAEATQPRGFHDLAQDSAGRFYYSAESDPVRYDLSATETDVTAKSAVFAGAQTNVAAPVLAQPRSLLVYRGGALQLPSESTAFVADPEKGLVRLVRLHRSAFSDALLISAGYTNDCDFVQAQTPGFTPQHLTMGPDGALYIADKGDSASLRAGGIYRVLHSSTKKEFRIISENDLLAVDLLGDQNAWVRDTVQHAITWRNATNLVPKLQQSFRTSPNQLLRFHALLALEGMSQVDTALLSESFNDANQTIAVEGMRLAKAPLAGPARGVLLKSLLKLARQKGNFINIQLEMFRLLALSPASDTVPVVAELIARGLHGDSVVKAALAASSGQELSIIAQMISDPRCVGSSTHEKLIEILSMELARNGRPEDVANVVRLGMVKREPSGNTGKAILTGVLRGLPERSPGKGRVTISQETWAMLNGADPAIRELGQKLKMLLERN